MGTLLTGPSARAEEPAQAVVLGMLELLPDLFERYEVKKGDFVALALALAFAHEPDFQKLLASATKRRKTKRTVLHDARQLELWWAVVSYQDANPGSNIKSACFKVGQRPEWKRFTKDSARDRFNEAKRSPLVQWAADARKKLGKAHFAEIMRGAGGRRGIDLARLSQDCDRAGTPKFRRSKGA